jgi:hypothetical protein
MLCILAPISSLTQNGRMCPLRSVACRFGVVGVSSGKLYDLAAPSFVAVPCQFHRNCLHGNLSLYWKCNLSSQLLTCTFHQLGIRAFFLESKPQPFFLARKISSRKAEKEASCLIRGRSGCPQGAAASLFYVPSTPVLERGLEKNRILLCHRGHSCANRQPDYPFVQLEKLFVLSSLIETANIMSGWNFARFDHSG